MGLAISMPIHIFCHYVLDIKGNQACLAANGRMVTYKCQNSNSIGADYCLPKASKVSVW